MRTWDGAPRPPRCGDLKGTTLDRSPALNLRGKAFARLLAAAPHSRPRFGLRPSRRRP